MKYGVSPNTLLITAGTIWSLAGVNILRIGLTCWIDDGHYWLFKVCEASLVFLLFFGIIFHRLYKKHTLRISQKKGKHCPFSFFDVKGWIVMIGMIAMGIVIRTCHLLPDSFIAVFYTGLSLALRHRATLHLVLVEEQITPDSPIPILCRLRQSADRLALYPFRLIAIPRQFPSHAVALGPYPHRHFLSQTSP